MLRQILSDFSPFVLLYNKIPYMDLPFDIPFLIVLKI